MAAKQRSLKVEGIVLRHREWGEADRMLTLFTRELGKVQALAKGIRKPRSRKAGHVEPFSRATLLLARGRSFFILTQADGRIRWRQHGILAAISYHRCCDVSG